MILSYLYHSFLGITFLEWIGYAASLFILIGMTMTSVRRLRWINLGGNILFTLYGFLIGSFPVALMNALIGVVNSWYLVRLYRKKESFRLLPVQMSNRYLKAFIEFHQSDIEKFFPGFRFDVAVQNRAYIVLRDMTVAAVIVGSTTEPGALHIDLDYAVAAYRDMKPGNYAFGQETGGLASEGFKIISTTCGSRAHEGYLRRCGFRPGDDGKLWYRVIA